MKNLIKYINNGNYGVYCPMCKGYFSGSDYLKTVFTDEKQLWLANMVTHYRHSHIESWNKCWGYRGSYYRSRWFSDYEEEKHKVNERAKRQIIRKCTDYLLYFGFTVEDFTALQSTEQKTIELATKKIRN